MPKNIIYAFSFSAIFAIFIIAIYLLKLLNKQNLKENYEKD